MVTGVPAWLIHRSNHIHTIPTLERKICVLASWLISALFGRDIVPIVDVKHPRAAFVQEGMPEHHSTDMCDESTANEERVDTA